MLGLARVGAAFPEFRESAEWRKLATDTLYAQLAQQVYPDGAQFELSTGYQYVALASFLQVYRTAKRSGMELPADYAQRLAAMYRCDLYLAEPDWRLPDLNDGSRRSVLDSLAVGAREVASDDPVLQWAASGGKAGTPPTTTSTLFPYAGWMVMRSGWQGADERYALLEAGPYGYGHQHEDKLNLIVYGYGREHISDAGYYDYDASDWRRYVLSTRGHNTIRVDGQDQHRAGLHGTYVTKDAVTDLTWQTNNALDYGAGVYADGYGPERMTKVTHRRELVFVKPDYFLVVDELEGEGEHQIESLFHLNHDEAEIDGPVARSVDPGAVECGRSRGADGGPEGPHREGRNDSGSPGLHPPGTLARQLEDPAGACRRTREARGAHRHLHPPRHAAGEAGLRPDALPRRPTPGGHMPTAARAGTGNRRASVAARPAREIFGRRFRRGQRPAQRLGANSEPC